MRVALVHHTKLPVEGYGGTERVVVALAAGLVALGHEVTLVDLTLDHVPSMFELTCGEGNEPLWTYMSAGPFPVGRVTGRHQVERDGHDHREGHQDEFELEDRVDLVALWPGEDERRA